MPGEGSNSHRQNRRWVLRGRDGIYRIGAVPRILLFLQKYSQVAGVVRRREGECFTVIHLPPGFGGMNLPLPRATREAFATSY